MLNCIVLGSNDTYLMKCTLDTLVKQDVASIIVATTNPCLEELCKEYTSDRLLFSKKQFTNGNEARNFAFEKIDTGRILIIESGTVVTEKSLAVHNNANGLDIVCGLYTRLYDFEHNFQDGIGEKEYDKRSDIRLHQKENKEFPWTIWRDNNISVDIKEIRPAGEWNSVFCVDGVTQNAEMAFELYKRGFRFLVSEEAHMNVYTKLEEEFIQPAKLDRLYIWFTDRCNYHCRMCRIGQKAYSPLRYTEPSLEDVKKLVLVAKEAGVTKVELYGGEMLMRKELFEVIEFCNQLEIEAGFVSNGSLITEEAAERFAKLQVEDIPISLDGIYEELNDWVRGKNAWERTMEGIRCLKKYGVPFSIFTVVLKQNFRHLSGMISLAKNLGAESISFQPVSSRQGGNQYDDFVLESSDIPELEQEIRKAFEMADKLNFPIRSRSMVKAIPEYILRGEQLLMQRGCVLPSNDALITKTGKLQLCFTAFGSGKLYQKAEGVDFIKVWQSEPYQELRKLAVKGQCPGCLANCSDQKYLLNDSE